MAKDKYDLNVGFDSELDRELAKLDAISFGEPIKPKNKREAVFQSFKDVGRGTKEAFTPNFTNLERLAKASLPSALMSEYMDIERGFGKMKTSLGKQLNETKRLGREATKTLKSLFPEESRIGKLFGRLENKLSDGMSAEQMAQAQQDQLAAGLQAELQDNFTKEATLQLINQNLEAQRHNSVLSALQAIHNDTTLLKNFSIHVTNNYYRKSLELQYKTLFVMKENVAVVRALAQQQRAQLEAITKNTAMPEVVKNMNRDYLAYAIKSSAADRIKKSLYDMMGGSKLDKMFQNVTRRLSMHVENFNIGLSSLIQGTDSIKMLDGLDGMGVSKSYMAGNMAAEYLRDVFGRIIGERLASTEKGAKFIFNAKNIASDPASYARQYVEKRREQGKNKTKIDRALNKMLSWVGSMGDSGNQYLGSIYNISDPNKLGGTFDNKTQLSIVKIIPDLLSKIYSEIKTQRVGGEPTGHEVVWDYNRQKLVNRQKFKENIQTDYKRLAQSKLKYPLGDLIGEISKHCKLSNADKGKLAVAIIQFVTHPSGSVNITSLQSKLFMDMLPKELRDPVWDGIDKMLSVDYKNTWKISGITSVLSTIRNSIPSMQAQIDDLVSIGEADTARSLSLLERRREDNTFIVNRDKTLEFIKNNFGGYDETWETGSFSATSSVSRLLRQLSPDRKIRKQQIMAMRAKNAAVNRTSGFFNKGIDAAIAKGKRFKQFYETDPRLAGLRGNVDQAKSWVNGKIEAVKSIKMSTLRDAFKSSPEYLSGQIQRFEDWMEVNGFEREVKIIDDTVEQLTKLAKTTAKKGKNAQQALQNMTLEKALDYATNIKDSASEVWNDERLDGVKNLGSTLGQMGVQGGKSAAQGLKRALSKKNLKRQYVKTKKKLRVPLSVVNTMFYESKEYALGYATDVMTWAKQTGIGKYIDIFNDYKEKAKKGIMGMLHKANEYRKQYGIFGAAKEGLLNLAAKIDPLRGVPPEERMNYLFQKFVSSKEYLEGKVTDFREWLLAQGRSVVDGAMSKTQLIKRAFSKDGIFSVGNILKFTRSVDRKIVGGIFKGIGKGIKFAGKLALSPFSRTGRKVIGKGLKFGTLATLDAVTGPFVQMFNLIREGMGMNPVFEKGFLGSKFFAGTKKADRKAARQTFKTIRAIKSSITTGISKAIGFIFRPRVSMAEEAAKQNLSPDTQILAAGLDRIAGNMEAQAEAENIKKKKERAGNWLSRLGLFGKKKKDGLDSTTKSAGLLGWLKKHKTGLTIAGGFLLIGGLLKGLGVTFEDVKNIASGIWSGIKGVVSGIRWLVEGVKSIADKIGGFLPDWFGGNKTEKVPVIDPTTGKPVIDPNTGQPMMEERVVEEGFASKAIKYGAGAAGAALLLSPFKATRSLIGLGMKGAGKFLGASWAAGKWLGNKVTGGLIADAAAKKAADKAKKEIAKQAGKEAARREAGRIVANAIEGLKARGNTWIASGLQAGKDHAVRLLAKPIGMWNTVKTKVKWLGRAIKNPKLLASGLKTAIKKGAVKLTAMIAGLASGIGGLLTGVLLAWEIGWILWYMFWDDMSLWQAISKQLFGVDLFDPKELEKYGVSPEELDQIGESAVSAENGESTLYTTTTDNGDGTITKRRYYIKRNDANYTAEERAKKMMGAKPLTQEDRDKYKHLAKQIVAGNVSPAEKQAVIQDIIKGKHVNIAGIRFGINNKEISPGLVNPGGGDFKSYGPEMKARIMSFGWDVLEKTGLPLKINGPMSGMRTPEEQIRLAGQTQNAARTPNGAHVRGFGIDLHHTDETIGSDLTKIPGVKDLLEKNQLKLPLTNLLNYTGKAANEGWHVEMAEARPHMGTMGDSGPGKFGFDETAIARLTQGTKKSNAPRPIGELDDIVSEESTVLKRLDTGSKTISSSGGGLTIPEGRSTTDTLGKAYNSDLKNAINGGDWESIKSMDIGGDTSYSEREQKVNQQLRNIYSSAMGETNSILGEQLKRQIEMVYYLKEISKNGGMAGSGVRMNPKSGQPQDTFMPSTYPVELHNHQSRGPRQYGYSAT